MTKPTFSRLVALFAAAAALPLAPLPARAAAAPSTAPQVLLAITNSESMDGTTAGAIMVGSGGLDSGFSSFSTSSSPITYTVPSGFVPPLGNNGDGTANYTVTCSGTSKCDNGPSRLNMTKAAITSVLGTYGSSLNFGIYTYSTGGPSLYTTWVYYMSPAGGFTFTNTASASTVANPCYNYGSASSSVKSSCGNIVSTNLYTNVSTSQYMTIGTSSDNALINDVLYMSSSTAGFVTYGTVSPTNPYTSYSLNTYNTNLGGYSVSYSKNSAGFGGWATTPTNAGYVPFSPQVMYSMRGFGYGASQSATTGSAKVAMGTDPASSTFTNALLPETNNSNSSEIKSLAGQSGIYALMNGAKSYLNGISHASCQGQYVVLLTDGLPTLDHSGNAWPPLGTTTGNAYSLTASYNSDGSFSTSNSQAVTDAVSAITALYTAGIKVYVIGLGAGVDPNVNAQAANLLTAMAIAGGTTAYYPATDSNSLNQAFATIVDLIYSESAISAPVAPISVASGSAYEYKLTTIQSPGAGHVKAYATQSDGTRSNTASWDAPTLMSTANRTASLMSTKSDGTIVTLANVEAAAWSLTPTACVPNTATEISYIVNPAYSYNSCSYLAGRDSSWLLGPFSTQNTGRYAGPPSTALLVQKYPTYTTYARGLSTRTQMLMFTDTDGFLYSVDANSGALKWGWTSRNLLPKFQNYATFAAGGNTDGNFAIVDAMDASAAWGSYVVGSFQSGAEHWSLKIDSSGLPSRVIYDTVVASGQSAGDKAGTLGTVPTRSPTTVAYIGNSAYAVYVITVGTTSTLWETNVATGATSSAVLSFTNSAALALNPASNQLYLGGTNGSVWVIALTSGTAATDLGSAQQVGSMVNPANGSSAGSVLYVGYTEIGPAPYIYAFTGAQLTVFGVAATGWRAVWATTPSQGYTYNGTAWSTSSTVTKLTTGSLVSDIPIVIGNALLVPVYVAGSGCSTGHGYYDFFSVATGTFPSDLSLTTNGQAVTSDIDVGNGQAFTPSITLIAQGVALNDCTSDPNCSGVQKMPTSSKGRAITWRQH